MDKHFNSTLFFAMETLNNDVHIGKIIDKVLKEKGLTYTQFARLLYCDRSTIYGLVQNKSIDVDKLVRISMILDYDFLKCYYPDDSSKLTINLPQEQVTQLRDREITSVAIEIVTKKPE